MSYIKEITKEDIFESIAKTTEKPKEELTVETNLMEICNGNIFKLGLILYDIHETFEQELAFDESAFADNFKTIDDILKYFALT